MANDLAAMKARVASEMARPDLTSSDQRIADAINDAISVYQSERFTFSDMADPTTPPSFNTVALQTVYGQAASAFISDSFHIDYLNVLIGGTLEHLPRDEPETIRLLLQAGTTEQGQPERWAYEGRSILIYPAPNQAYTIYMGVFRSVPAPATDDEANNPWMTTAEMLIRSRAKYELAVHVTRNEAMQLAMSPHDPPAGVTTGHATYFAFRRLKGVAARQTGLGRMRAMPF